MTIQLPTLSRTQVALDNAMVAMSQPLRLALAGHDLELFWTRRPAPFTAVVALDLAVQGMPAKLLVDSDPTDAILDLPVAAEDIARLPAGFQGVLIAGALGDVLEPLTKLGLPAEPRAFHRGAEVGDARGSFAPDGVRLAWELRDAAGRIWIRGDLLLAAELALRVTALVGDLATAGPEVDIDAWSIAGRVVLGRTALTLGELHGIELGDVIMVGEHRWGESEAEVCIGDRFCYGVAVGEAALTVLRTREIRRVSEDEAGEARQGADDGGVPSEAPLTDADDMPVTVSFDLGQIDVPLGELRRIDEGYTFNLHKPLDGAVTLRINGRLVGKGELVEIEGSLGVRVAELLAKRHG